MNTFSSFRVTPKPNRADCFRDQQAWSSRRGAIVVRRNKKLDSGRLPERKPSRVEPNTHDAQSVNLYNIPWHLILIREERPV